ncbi:MAG: cupin domain-containing protein [Acidobacteria bacterium]|nr:cupin domain-containing protein [Acidobacteriota bacterium]
MNDTTHAPLPTGLLDVASLPWQPIFPGFTLKALRATGDDDARALLLRLEPGTLIPRHRHTGDVHAYNLSGQRLLIETNTLVGPGGYVYEPAGNVDSWMAVGDEPCIVFVVAQGAVEYLDEEGRVLRRSTTGSTGDAYRRFCEATR